ncbi:hypothetical protein [Leisingera sp. F5]|uniref:hypothetical protein n=1 Tax=Leisingera sp. F5 TaxID=1813816 RepID=UPI0025C17E1E|nr:hypothetical protein [Leisingera sp. F5]
MKKLSFRIAVMCFVFCASLVRGGEISSDQRYLTDRYILHNVNIPTLTHWRSGISVELAGDVPLATSFSAISRLKFLSENADADVQMVGSAENWFSSKTQVSGEANYLILFEDLSSKNLKKGNLLHLSHIETSMAEANPGIKALFEEGLTHLGTSCYGKWKASVNNVVWAFAAVVDTSMSIEDQLDCLKYNVPASLGAHPYVTTLDFHFTDKEGAANKPVFFDESEIVLQLRLSAYCRNVLKRDSLECPAHLFGQLLRHHKVLLSNLLSPKE